MAPPRRSGASCARPGSRSSAPPADAPGRSQLHRRGRRQRRPQPDVGPTSRGVARASRSIPAARRSRAPARSRARAPSTCRARSPSAGPTPSSMHLDHERRCPSRFSRTIDEPLDRTGAVARERVVDRVLHQLVEHDRERRGHLARQLAGVALDLEPERHVGRRDGLLHRRARAAGRSRRTRRRRRRRVTASRARSRSSGCAAPTPRSPPAPPASRAAGPAAGAAPRSSAGCSSPGGGSRGSSRPSTAACGRGGGGR